jgi:hypothetical protein
VDAARRVRETRGVEGAAVRLRVFFVLLDLLLVVLFSHDLWRYGAQRNAGWGLLAAFLVVAWLRLTVRDVRATWQIWKEQRHDDNMGH